MFGINGGELLVLLLVAAIVVGPERLPRYAEQLARWARTWRATLTTTKDRLAAELGEEDVDWAALDPRRYDPRRIVRDALAEPVATPAAGGAGRAGAGGPTPSAVAGQPAPFDDEAT